MPNELNCRSKVLAAEIRAELARQEKSVNEIAEVIGMPISTLRRSVKGQRSLTVDELADIAAYLGVSVVELLRRASHTSEPAA